MTAVASSTPLIENAYVVGPDSYIDFAVTMVRMAETTKIIGRSGGRRELGSNEFSKNECERVELLYLPEFHFQQLPVIF